MFWLWMMLVSEAFFAVHALERQWYQMGQERNGNPTVKDFRGLTVDIWELFGDENDVARNGSSSFEREEEPVHGNDPAGQEGEKYVVFFGGVIRSEKPNVVDEKQYESFGSMVKSKFKWLTEVEVCGVRVYDLYSSLNFAVENPTPYSIEVAQFNIQKQTFENHTWRNVVVGLVAAVSVVDISSGIQYRVLLNADAANRVSVMYFSVFVAPEESHSSMQTIFVDSERYHPDADHLNSDFFLEDNVELERAVELNIISYNIWHTMPPAWVYHDARDRIERYSRRIEFLAEMVIAEKPDVVLFQEVRLDSSFRLSARDSGSQVEHLLHFLRRAEVKAGLCRGGGGEDDTGCTRWNILFQPAMSMFDKRNTHTRHEEGLAIFTRAELPLSHPGALLLPRDLSLVSDDHNRAVLGACIQVSSVGDTGTVVSIMTSHFSLDASARKRAVAFLFRHITHAPYGTILGGDLNGESGEEFLTMLVDSERREQGLEQGLRPFYDAFETASAMGGVKSTGSGHAWVGNGFTFPSCNPEKRIDFLLVRNPSHGNVDVRTFKLLGTDHREYEDETNGEMEFGIGLDGNLLSGGDLGGRTPDVGMLDSDSHLWASDHFGIAGAFRILF